jgi:hypothetical protein
LELVRDHAKLSVIHLGLLSLHPQQHTLGVSDGSQ